MADRNHELAILVRTEVTKALRDFERTKKGLKDQGDAADISTRKINKLSGAYTSLGAAIGAAFSIATARRLIEDFKQQEQAVAALDASLASMGRTSGGLSQQLQTLASEIQGEGIIGDEAIIKGQSFLTTYSTISDDLLPRTTRLMVDLAAKMKGDVVSAANLVGKASMGMTGELSRVGITLSDETKKSKDFVKILDEMESQVAGMNKALGATATGGIDQFDNALGDMREGLGEILAIGVSDYLREASKEMALSDETVKELGADLKILIGHLDEAAIGIGGLMIARSVGPALGVMAANTVLLARSLPAMNAGLLAAQVRTSALAGAASLARGALAFLGGPVGLIITAATALAVWASNSEDAAASTENYSAKLKQLQGDLKGVELAQLNASIAQAEADRQRLLEEMKGTFGKEYARLFARYGEVNRYLNEARHRADELAAAARSAGDATKALGDAGDNANDPLKKLIDKLEEQRNTLGLTADELLRYQAEQAIAAVSDKTLAGAVREATEALIAKRQAVQAELDEEAAFEAAVKASEKAVKDENAAYQQWLESLDQAAQAVRDMIDPLQPLREEMAQLDLLLNAGKLSWEEWSEATLGVQTRMDELNGQAEETGETMNQFAIQAARNMQSHLANYLFDPFDDGLKGMVRGFAETLHRMISELLAQQALISFFTSLGGTVGGTNYASQFLTAITRHAGGTGRTGPTRQISPLAFINAPRYHSGNTNRLLGLQPDEMTAVIKEDEEVLTRDNPRHILNQGQGGGGDLSLRAIFVDDQRDIGNWLTSSTGEKTVVQVVQRNKSTLQRILGIRQ